MLGERELRRRITERGKIKIENKGERRAKWMWTRSKIVSKRKV